jgi:hypothetical protein
LLNESRSEPLFGADAIAVVAVGSPQLTPSYTTRVTVAVSETIRLSTGGADVVGVWKADERRVIGHHP